MPGYHKPSISLFDTLHDYFFTATSALYDVRLGRPETDTTAIDYVPSNFDRIFVDTTTHAVNLYLPPVGEWAGKTLFIQNLYTANLVVYPYTESGGADSTILDGSGAQTSQTLSTAYGFTLLWSSGRQWIVLAFDLSI
jgi:hypothetical protein